MFDPIFNISLFISKSFRILTSTEQIKLPVAPLFAYFRCEGMTAFGIRRGDEVRESPIPSFIESNAVQQPRAASAAEEYTAGGGCGKK